MFLDYLLNGLGLGAVFAFIALGYTMVYGIIRLINFAHGEFVMVGAFAGYFVMRDAGLDRLPWPEPLPVLAWVLGGLLAAGLASGLLAVTVERLAYRPVRKAGRIAALLTAVGVSLLLQNLAIQVWSADSRAYPDPRIWVEAASLPDRAPADLWIDRTFTTTDGEEIVERSLEVREGEAIDAARREALAAAGHHRLYRVETLSKAAKQGFVILALVVCAPLLWLLVRRTRTGKAMRAVSEDMDAARLMGIPIDRVVAATFFLGGVLGGVAGVAYCAMYVTVEPMTGFLPGLKAFIAAVIGGIGSIPGAIVGGLLLGVIESVVPFLLQEAGWQEAYGWKDAIAFTLLIVILLVKPTGLLGRPLREKV